MVELQVIWDALTPCAVTVISMVLWMYCIPRSNNRQVWLRLPSCSEFVIGNRNIYLYFLSFLEFEMAQIIGILVEDKDFFTLQAADVLTT